MTKKDYIRAAKLVKQIEESNARAIAALTFAHFFMEDNSRFDENKFLTACGTTAIPVSSSEEEGEEWNPNDLVSQKRDEGKPDPSPRELAEDRRRFEARKRAQ